MLALTGPDEWRQWIASVEKIAALNLARAVTPAIEAALRSTLAHYLPERRYLSGDGRLDRQRLDSEPVIRNIFKGRLDSQPNARYLYVYTSDWLKLLETFAPEKHSLLEPLGQFARRVRNTAAHEIVAISHEKLKQDGGMSAQELLRMLAGVTGADLTIFDRLNSEIIRLIDEAPLG